jgi:wobble nucleotide-excising tRNase
MSVDQNHLDRFIDLIHSEAAHFSQIIITTHYGPWRDRYRNNRAPSGDMLFLELRKWSKENGIRVKNSKIALDELKEMLSDEDKFHRENISTAAGRTLENILDYLTYLFTSKLPRKPKSDYQLHELLTCLSSQLVKLLRVEHLEKDEQGNYSSIKETTDLHPVIEKLKQLKAVRNQVGAHYNFDGQLVSDDDVTDFGNAAVEFAEFIICPETGALPDRKPSGSYWETKSGSIRLYPLIDPKS